MKTVFLIGLGIYIGRELFSRTVVSKTTAREQEQLRKRLMRYLAEHQPLLSLKDRMRDTEMILNP